MSATFPPARLEKFLVSLRRKVFGKVVETLAGRSAPYLCAGKTLRQNKRNGFNAPTMETPINEERSAAVNATNLIG